MSGSRGAAWGLRLNHESLYSCTMFLAAVCDHQDMVEHGGVLGGFRSHWLAEWLLKQGFEPLLLQGDGRLSPKSESPKH